MNGSALNVSDARPTVSDFPAGASGRVAARCERVGEDEAIALWLRRVDHLLWLAAAAFAGSLIFAVTAS